MTQDTIELIHLLAPYDLLLRISISRKANTFFTQLLNRASDAIAPTPLLRRQVEHYASRDLVLHALAKKVKTYQECNVVERLLEDLARVGSIPRLAEGVMRQIVDFAIRIHRLINNLDSPYYDALQRPAASARP